MKPSEIRVGATYRNSGAGRTKRTVLKIARDVVPYWKGFKSTRPDECGVLYSQNGVPDMLYLCSFAKWAGSEVT